MIKMRTDVLGGIVRQHVTLDGDVERCVGDFDKITDTAHAISIALRLREAERRRDAATEELHRACPGAQVYLDNECPPDIDPATWPAPDGVEVAYCVSPRRRRGYAVLRDWRIVS